MAPDLEATEMQLQLPKEFIVPINGHKNGKKMNPLKSDPISLYSLNINAVHSGISKPIKLVKPSLTTRCRQTVARPPGSDSQDPHRQWVRQGVRLHMAGCIWSSPQLGH